MDGQKEKGERIAVFAGKEFVIVYNYLGKSFRLDLSKYRGADVYYMNPQTGDKSYVGKVSSDIYEYKELPNYTGDEDRVILIKL